MGDSGIAANSQGIMYGGALLRKVTNLKHFT